MTAGRAARARPSRTPQTTGPPPSSIVTDSRLIERYWLPQHDLRRVGPLFLRNKRFLRDEVRLPCWVCRRRGSARNPLEVHHIFEWALWNAVDRRRVTRILEALEFYEEGYLAAAGPRREALEAALDRAKRSGPLRSPDDLRNLVVLCQLHHRSRFTGTHLLSFPIWLALAALRRPLARAGLVRAAGTIRRLDEAVADIVRPARD